MKTFTLTILSLTLLVVVAVYGFSFMPSKVPSQVTPDNISSSSIASIQEVVSSEVVQVPQPKVWDGKAFEDLYANYKYNFVGTTSELVDIYGNVKANQYVANKAEKRGYTRRAQAIETRLVKIDSQRLQPEATDAYIQLKSNAKAEGLTLVLVSGYRSVANQKSIFNSRFVAPTTAAIIDGSLDTELDEVLSTSSVPGYSRHHTGYTFDIGCNSSELVTFKNTQCFDWISKDNYAQARKAGLIPSYPDGATNQGPNPEEWEYVWVGVEALKN